MPLSANTRNATRLTKSITTAFRLRVPLSSPVMGWWRVNTLVKPIFTTAGTATAVTLTLNSGVYRDATYTWIAGITTTITVKLANYFVTGTTTTETPYSITPTYNFNNIGHYNDATAFYSTAIKSITVTVQNSYTNAAVSGATMEVRGINGDSSASDGNATQTVTTNSSGQATVYVSGTTMRYIVSATRYETLNTTNTNTSNFTIKLVPSEVTITITVNDASTGSRVGSGVIVKLSSNNTSTAYSGTTNSSGQVVLKIKPGNYWWEAGGSTTWGGNGTGDWNYPNRSTTSISLVKDQSITIEALKVGVWVNDFATYTNMNGSETDYTGFDARYQTSGAMPSNNRSIFTDIDFNENNKFLFSFGRTQDVANNRNLLKNKVFRPNNKTMTGDWDSLFNDYDYQYLQEVQVVSSGITYFKKESDRIYFGLYAAIIKNLQRYYSVQFNVLRVNEFSSSLMNLGWSEYPINQIWVDESFNMYSINNTLCSISAFEADGSNYNYGYYITSSAERDNRIYLSIMKQSNYTNIENIDIIDIYLDKTVQSYQYNFLTKRIYYKYNSSADEVQIIILGFARTSDQWRCFIITYNGDIQLLGAINHRYRSFENIPSSVNDNMGTNGWVSPNLKWFFHTPLIKNESNYFDKKGLGTVRGVNALFDMNGWSSTTYYQDDDSTLDLRNTLANYYVLEIQFNKNNNKILVLCNDTQGAFRKVVNNDYVNGCSPTHIFAFVYNGKKWVQLSQSLVGLTDIWNTYQNSMSGKTNLGFKPPFIISPNYEGKLKISYIYPAMERIYTAYQGTLTFGD